MKDSDRQRTAIHGEVSSTALIGHLLRRLGTLSLLRRRGLTLLLPLGVLRRHGSVAGDVVHGVGRRMRFDVSRSGRDRSGGAGRGT